MVKNENVQTKRFWLFAIIINPDDDKQPKTFNRFLTFTPCD